MFLIISSLLKAHCELVFGCILLAGLRHFDVVEKIDSLDLDLNIATDTLSKKTNENSIKIIRLFSAMYVIIKFGTLSIL